MRSRSYPQTLLSFAESKLLSIDSQKPSQAIRGDHSSCVIKAKELQAYGASVLGPSLLLFYTRLAKKILFAQENHPNLYFLAREGYLLEKGYLALQDLLGTLSCSRYLTISRVLMFRALLDDQRSHPLICSHNFSGSIERLLISRCGLSSEEIKTIELNGTLFPKGLGTLINLPADTSKVTQLIEHNSETIKSYASTTRENYLEYLSNLGAFHESRIHIVDLGYSGTIQKCLSLLTGKPIVGHYFITTPAAKNTRNNKFLGHLFSNRRWGTGCSLLDQSLILEALLTAPTGSAQGIQKTQSGMEFSYGPITKAQQSFHILEQVFDGAISYCSANLRLQNTFSPLDVDWIYDLITCPKTSTMPLEVSSVLEVEDSFSGLGIINPNSLYSNQQ
jgi:hypothetical protein